MNLFEAAAEAAKQRAIEQVGRAADPSFLASALSAVETLTLCREEFTTDDVWAIVHDWEVREPRALCAVMLRAAHLGWISRTDRVRYSQRPVNHRRPVAVWRSNLRGV
jgi:hypothetical protein